MKISDINVSYLEDLLMDAKYKNVILWGAGKQIEKFINQYCGDLKLLPNPKYVLETTRKPKDTFVCGIPIIDSLNGLNLNPDNSIIIITAGLMELQGKAVSEEFYYFPMVHRRSIEAFDYFRKNSEKCDEAISLLTDAESKYIYKKVFQNIINGVLWDQSLYSPSPYFGNNLIDKIPNNGLFIFAGAFNGKHLVRANRNNSDVSILAMEPSKFWHDKIRSEFSSYKKITIGNALFWDETTKLGYDEDKINNGLGASIVSDISKADYFLDTVTIDEAVGNTPVAHIALDIEGAEQKALLGAKNSIKKFKPNLCICLYHSLDDYFSLPIILNSYGGYSLHVKQHSILCPIETVLYALPTTYKFN